MTRILMALDQSTSAVGYAIVDLDGFHRNHMGLELPGRLIDSGVINSFGKDKIKSVLTMAQNIKDLADKHRIQAMAVEGHVYQNMKQWETVEAMATITFLCRHIAQELEIGEPERIYVGTLKACAGGHGKADKAQVKEGTCKYWGINPVKDDNESDALGMAQTYLQRGSKELQQKARRA